MSGAFFVVFLWYPGFCTRAFEMLRCRTIFPGFGNHSKVSVLHSDYSVSCDDSWHEAHVIVAYVFICVALLIPGVVIWRLHKITVKDSSSLDISHHVSSALSVGVVDAQEAITNLVTARSYAFLTAGLSSRYPWCVPYSPIYRLSCCVLPRTFLEVFL